MMKTPRIFAFPVIALVLSACFDGSQDVTVSEDGQTLLVSWYAIENDSLPAEQQSEYCPDGEYEANGVVTIYESSAEATQFICTSTTTGHIDDMVAGFAEDREEYEQVLEQLGTPHRNNLTHDGDVYTYRESFALGSLFKPSNMPDVDEAVLQTFEGRSFRYSLTAPRILSSTAPISDDGKTTEVELPFADDSQLLDLEFEVQFSL